MKTDAGRSHPPFGFYSSAGRWHRSWNSSVHLEGGLKGVSFIFHGFNHHICAHTCRLKHIHTQCSSSIYSVNLYSSLITRACVCACAKAQDGGFGCLWDSVLITLNTCVDCGWNGQSLSPGLFLLSIFKSEEINLNKPSDQDHIWTTAHSTT